MATLTDLPAELLAIIVDKLRCVSQARLARTCRLLRNVVREHADVAVLSRAAAVLARTPPAVALLFRRYISQDVWRQRRAVRDALARFRQQRVVERLARVKQPIDPDEEIGCDAKQCRKMAKVVADVGNYCSHHARLMVCESCERPDMSGSECALCTAFLCEDCADENTIDAPSMDIGGDLCEPCMIVMGLADLRPKAKRKRTAL